MIKIPPNKAKAKQQMEKYLQLILQAKLISLMYKEFSTNQKENNETNRQRGKGHEKPVYIEDVDSLRLLNI